MLEYFKILTITHKKTQLKAIGDFALKEAEALSIPQQLQALRQSFGIAEILYLSTCNRVLYCFYDEVELSATFVQQFFQAINPTLTPAQIEHAVLQLEGQAAIQHLFEVAASVDSLVVGERQILRQLREAYDLCKKWELTGDNIRLLVQQAVLTAKEIYARTGIGEKPVSVVSLAFRQMMQANLSKEARILLIGAGQTNALVAKFLAKYQFSKVTVFNRSLAKAEELAAVVKGNAHPLSDLSQFQSGFDCLIVCTSASDPIITTQVYEQLLKGELEKKIVVDLGIPHNVSSAVIEKFPLRYIEIESLRELAKENLAHREEEVHAAKAIVEKQAKSFPAQLRQRHLVRAIQKVPEEISAIRSKAVKEIFGKEVAQLDDNTRDLIDRILAYMEKKCIAIPMKVVKDAALPF